MKKYTSLVILASVTLVFAGCSKHSQTAAFPKKNDLGVIDVSDGKPSSHTSVGDKDTVLPGRHMSESQVADIAFRELPRGSSFRCEFKDGVWEILEVQKGVWGVSSVTTNADGKVFVSSTNATRVVLRVLDADGKVEQVKTP